MKCPCCNSQRGHKRHDEQNIGLSDVYRCKKCGAVFGTCYKGDSYSVVIQLWHQGEVDPADTFYYDLTVIGSTGVERYHGWAHKTTRKVVQTG